MGSSGFLIAILLSLAACGGETTADDACAAPPVLGCDDSRCEADPNFAILGQACFPKSPGLEYSCITASDGLSRVLCAPVDGGCGFAMPVTIDAGACP